MEELCELRKIIIDDFGFVTGESGFMNFINYNGDIFPANQPVLTAANRSYKYGDGLFESIRMVNGKVMFAEYHAARLQEGMKALKFDHSDEIDEIFLKEKIIQLALRNRIGENARIRVTVFRDGEGFYSPTDNKYGYTIEMTKTDEALYTSNTRGLIVNVYEELTKPVNYLSNYKTCNSLIYVMAGLFRKQHSLDEVFILNQNGFLCEAMSSNVFILFDKKLYTPSLAEGCVAGVMRRVVMELAEKSGLPVIEAQINPDILNEAEEVFLTNAVRGVQWVMGFNSKRYFNKHSRMLLAELNKL